MPPRKNNMLGPVELEEEVEEQPYEMSDTDKKKFIDRFKTYDDLYIFSTTKLVSDLRHHDDNINVFSLCICHL